MVIQTNPSPRSRKPRFFAIAALLLAFFAWPAAQAATYYWDSNDATAGFGTANGTWAAPTTNDATQGWSLSANGTDTLSGTTTTTTADALHFGTSLNQLDSGTINVSGDVGANTLAFVGSSSNLTLSGGNITLNGGLTATNSANTTATTRTISSNVNLGASQTWTVNNGGSVGTTNLEVSGPVTGGSFGLTKTGNGTLTLSGAGNSWNGTTQIQTGTVNLSGSLTTNGTFQTGHSSSGSVLNITGNLTLTKSGDPRNFQVAQGNGHSGTVNVSGAGILNLTGMMLGENNGGNGTLNISGGTVTTTGAAWFSGRDCTITVTGGNFSAGANGVELGGGSGNTTSTINVSGTGLFNSGGLVLGRGISAGNTATTIINLGDGTTGGNLATTGFSYLNGASFNSNTINFNGGTLTAKGNFNINSGNHTTVVKSGGAFIDTGIFSMGISSNLTDGGGGGGLTKNGSGTLTLSGEGNSYTGTTTVNAGTLALGANNSLGAIAGSGALNLSSFNLTTTAAGNTTFSGAISGTGGSLTKNGAGTLTLSGANSYTGATTVNGGGLTTTGANMLSDSAAVTVGSGASLTLGGSDTVATIAGGGSISTGANTLTVSSSNNADFSGTITGTTGGFTKAGTGTQTLSGAGNSWNGNTAVSAGTLALSGSLTSNANVSVGSASGAVLNITGNFNQTKPVGDPRGFQLALNAGTSGTVNVSGSGILGIGSGMILGDNGGGNGTFNISGGTVTNAGATWFSGRDCTITVTGGTFNAGTNGVEFGGGSGNTTSTINVSGTGLFNIGTLVLGRGNSVGNTATTIINLGDGTTGGNFATLGISYLNGASFNSNTINFNGGTLTAKANFNINSANHTTVVKSGGAFIDTGIFSMTISSNLTDGGGGGGLTKNGSGTLTLSGEGNSYTGNTTVNAGTLALGANNSLGAIAGSGALNLSSFNLTTTAAGNTTFSGAISGAGGSLTKNGAGTLTLSGANSYTGATTVNGGGLTTTGANMLSDSAAVTVNSGASLTLGGSDTVATIAGGGSISTGASTLTVSSSNNADFSGTITGTTGGFTKAGTGTQTLSGAGNSWNGNTAVSAGTLALSGSLTSNANVSVGSASGAALNITGNLTQTKTTGGPRGFQLGASAGTSGTVNVSGSGILNIGTGMMLGDNGGGNGTFNISGGTVANAGETWFAGANSIFNVSGGSYTATSGWTYLGGGSGTITSSLTVNGTGTYTASTIDFGRGSTNATSIINLGDGTAGGNLSVSGLSYIQGPSPTINFNGGTLNVRSSISMITQAATVVKSGGAVIDVNSGQTFTLSNNLTTDGTGGGLTKNGAGTLTLSGAGNNYTGTTTLNAGTLSLGAANVIGDSSAVAVNGGTFELGTNAETLHSLNMSGGTLLRGGETLTLNNASSITGGTVVLSSQASSRINTTGLLTLGSASMNYTSTSGTAGTNILVLGGDIAVNPASTFNFIDSGGAAGNPRINLNNATRVFDVGNGANLNVGWDIWSSTASTGAITKNGSGTLTLNGSASHSGTTTLNEGQLNINTATAIGSGTLAINGGTIDNTSAAALTLSNNNAQRWNGDFTFGGTRDLNLGNGAVTMNASRTVTVNGGNLTVGGAIAGSGLGLAKEGLGTMILSGANTYNGTTTVNAGTLKLGASDRLANASSLVINSGGTFDIAGFSETITGLSGSGSLILASAGLLTIDTMAADTTFSGLISGSGTLNKVGGSGKFITLTNDSNSFTGNISIANGGTGFYVTTIGNIGQNSAAGAGERIIWNSNPQFWYIGTTNSSSNRTLEFTGGQSGLLGNSGTGTVSFTGNFVNTGSGAKIFYLDGNNTGSNLLGVNLVDNGNSTLNLTKQGTGKWIVSGNNTNTGGTSLKDGELSLGHKNALGTGTLFYDNTGGTPNAILTANTNLTGANAVSNNITLSAGGTKTIGGSNDLELSGTISGAGFGFTKNGTGTLILSGANTYTGATTITAGTLVVNGSLAAGSAVSVAGGATLGGVGTLNGPANISGILAPGNSPGVLSFGGNLSLGSTSQINMELNGATRGSEYDGINVGGALAYGGALSVNAGSQFMVSGQTFSLFTFGSQSGNLVSVSLAGAYGTGNFTGSGGVWSLTDSGGNEWSFSQATGNLAFTAVPEPSAWALLSVFGLACAGWKARAGRRRATRQTGNTA